MRTHIGIDPGASGGIAVIYPDGKAVAHKMPETPRDLLDLLYEIKIEARISKLDCVAALEAVHASLPAGKGEKGEKRFCMGVRQAFSFGKSFGMIEMAIIAAEISFVTVSPQKWQTAMSCRTGGDKNVSKAAAQALFPSIKITHAIADALLIAEYLRRTHK